MTVKAISEKKEKKTRLRRLKTENCASRALEKDKKITSTKKTKYERKHEFYTCEIFKICKSLTKRVVLHHDYMPFEFCIYLYKLDSKIYLQNRT